MAFGAMLSYDLVQSSYGGGVSSPWLDVVAVFQRHAFSRYAGERVTNYTGLGPAATQTSFETFAAIANWDDASSYTTAGYVLPPQGAMVKKNDGTLVAGVFAGYNGAALSAGDHYLVEERKSDQIIVRQPMGAATSLAIRLLPGWTSATWLEAWAFDKGDRYLGKTAVAVTADAAVFAYQRQVAGQAVAYYKIVNPNKAWLPVVLK
jgi:hypothetical protein